MSYKRAIDLVAGDKTQNFEILEDATIVSRPNEAGVPTRYVGVKIRWIDGGLSERLWDEVIGQTEPTVEVLDTPGDNEDLKIEISEP